MVQVARGQNSHTDSLATLASSMIEEVPWIIKVELVAKPSINAMISVSMIAMFEPCWMDSIIDFLTEDRVPNYEKEAVRISRVATRYWLSIDCKLYWRSFGGPYLLCLRLKKDNDLLAKLHEGVYSSHAGGRSLAH